MPSVRTAVPSARRSRLRGLVVAAAVASGVVLSVGEPAVASADDAAGSTVTGRLLQAWPEAAAEFRTAPSDSAPSDSGTDDGPLSWVQAADGQTVRVATGDVQGVTPGSTVQVTVGAPVTGPGTTDGAFPPALSVTDTKVVAPVTEPVVDPSRRLTNEVTVALVAPGGTKPDLRITPDQIAATVDGPVASFWRDQTNGAIRLGVTAKHGWITTKAGCTKPAALWDEAAAAVHFTPGPGKHLLLYVGSSSSSLPDCSYALAEVGSSPASGGRAYVRDTIPSVMAHELGHNFGLGHSSARQCDGTVDTGTCRTAPYRDLYDVMGVSWAQMGSLNAPQAARLGVLPAAQQRKLTVASAAGSVVLSPLSGRTGTRAVRLTDTGGVDYWLEYRSASAQDGWLGSDANRYGLQSGVLLLRSGGLPDTSLLLDGTPGAKGGWDTDWHDTLPVGSPITVAGGQFTITVQSVASAGAVVHLVPRAPAAAKTAAAKAPAASPGDVLPGHPSASTPRTTAARPAAQPVAPQAGVRSVTATGPSPASPRLVSAASSTPWGSLVVPVAGAVLAGALLLAARRLRRTG